MTDEELMAIIHGLTDEQTNGLRRVFEREQLRRWHVNARAKERQTPERNDTTKVTERQEDA